MTFYDGIMSFIYVISYIRNKWSVKKEENSPFQLSIICKILIPIRSCAHRLKNSQLAKIWTSGLNTHNFYKDSFSFYIISAGDSVRFNPSMFFKETLVSPQSKVNFVRIRNLTSKQNITIANWISSLCQMKLTDALT